MKILSVYFIIHFLLVKINSSYFIFSFFFVGEASINEGETSDEVTMHSSSSENELPSPTPKDDIHNKVALFRRKSNGTSLMTLRKNKVSCKQLKQTASALIYV